MIDGSTPAVPHDTSRATGVSPRFFAHSPLAITSAPAPSPMPDALPAVTTPSCLNTGRSLASPSGVVSGRMCSSRLNSSICFVFGFLSGMPTTSSSYTPLAHASRASCCERSAYSSTHERSSLYCTASFSAVSAIMSPGTGSLSASHSASSSGGLFPSGVPQRRPRAMCGACDIDSPPPTRHTSASPSRISCAPFTTA